MTGLYRVSRDSRSAHRAYNGEATMLVDNDNATTRRENMVEWEGKGVENEVFCYGCDELRPPDHLRKLALTTNKEANRGERTCNE